MAFRANIAYLAGEIATKVIESVQAKQKRAAVSQKAVETKQLSPRLAGEWFDIPDTTVCRHVAKKYAKFGAARLAVGAVLGEGRQKSIVQSLSVASSAGFGASTCIVMHNFNRSHWIPVEFILYTFIYLTAYSKPSMSARKRF